MPLSRQVIPPPSTLTPIAAPLRLYLEADADGDPTLYVLDAGGVGLLYVVHAIIPSAHASGQLRRSAPICRALFLLCEHRYLYGLRQQHAVAV